MVSPHRVEVIRIQEIEKHPNADKLGIVRIFGYTVCVRLGDFQEGDLVAYIVPDSIVPDSPLFSFLDGHYRIRVKRLRGIMSQGLLIKVPEGVKEGDDAAEILGVTRYEPPLPLMSGGEAEKPPRGIYPVYDVESWYRYKHLLVPGEEVIITEKIHGANGIFLWQDGRMYCGSRTEWKKENKNNLWWQALRQSSWLENFCRDHSDICVYGEVFGQVQDLKYGTRDGEILFRTFDLCRNGQWINFKEVCEIFSVNVGASPWVPIIAKEPYDEEKIKKFMDGPSHIPGAQHIREGIVIRPVEERTDSEIGRVQLKVVSNQYLERS
mgnify:FL=1